MKIFEPRRVSLVAAALAVGLGGCATAASDHRSTSPSKGTAVWDIASAPQPAAPAVGDRSTNPVTGGA